jgi:hypothetical protein
MKTEIIHLNLVLGWLWLLLGFLSGMILGCFFHDEHWLGGYPAFRRRMYRLAHVSFFGLGALNLLFWLTVRHLSLAGPWIPCIALAFIAGALTMPVCCVAMAHFSKVRFLFVVPVASLILGGVMMLVLLVPAAQGSGAPGGPVTPHSDQPSALEPP